LIGIRGGDGEIIRDAGLLHGVYIDLFIYPQQKVRQPDASMIRLVGGVPLVDPRGDGALLLSRLADMCAAGPPPLAPDEREARRVWASKMLDRVTQGDVEGNYRRAWLLFALLEDYFVIRNQWYFGPKASLHWLRENKPDLHDLFDKALKPEADISSIAALVSEVWAGARSFGG
jgi:uncharacterized protein